MQSLVTPVGYSADSCGYCKDASSGRRTSNSRASYHILSRSLSVDVYQGLVDRGWRRSGTTFYKPDVLRHCCPHYTVRLPAASFAPTKEHRQAVNRWNKHVLGDEYIKEAAKLYPKSKEEKIRLKNTFDLVDTTHESEYANLKRPPEPAHRFEVTLELDTCTVEKFELFKNYQENVHREPPSQVSQEGFAHFLCGSPLQRTTATVDGKTQQLGSFHQCYRYDGRLIAMGVLDLLPHCVSGVYFIYHSDFEKWSFGKLSALREVTLTLQGGYQYYYMGYYIHSCPKMRYKGEYKPQYVLDPETYDWNPLEGELRQLLDTKKFVSLSRERRLKEAQAAPTNSDNDSEQDSLNDYPLPTAAEARDAVRNGMSLFDLKVPGVMTVEDIKKKVQLDDQAIKIEGWPGTRTGELSSWRAGNLRDPESLKGIVAELVACIGPDVARQVTVGFY
ncbi:arginine-tRNA-protein transferase 1 [Melanomma pulvis-pyrius CBS 109.77]|uniref:Arginyl-tRNA--protein transferase 1 n=1 Tax=Melanomma pulvis-pyrius CBS 109.77 TaxID=1314802 RepID=A0A6A6WP72_9PLEO|nr:arginine-tRNA-protein transferase 1 [Melanomma pulvis-pyrius CBS 109.77]